MYVEVSVYLHKFKTIKGIIEVRSTDIDPKTVWANSGNDFEYDSYVGNIVTDETALIFLNF